MHVIGVWIVSKSAVIWSAASHEVLKKFHPKPGNEILNF